MLKSYRQVDKYLHSTTNIKNSLHLYYSLHESLTSASLHINFISSTPPYFLLLHSALYSPAPLHLIYISSTPPYFLQLHSTLFSTPPYFLHHHSTFFASASLNLFSVSSTPPYFLQLHSTLFSSAPLHPILFRFTPP